MIRPKVDSSATLLLILVGVMTMMGCTQSAKGSEATPTGLVELGAQLYGANCQSCHGGAAGGQMMDIPPPHNANGHTWHHSDCQIKDIVLNGSGEMGEMMRRMMGTPENAPKMPAFRDTLSNEDISAILAYIRTWWQPEQREFQSEVTRAQC